MPYVRVYVEADEVLDEIDDEALKRELARRQKKGADASDHKEETALLERAFEDLRGRDVPEALREYIWRVLGRCLP